MDKLIPFLQGQKILQIIPTAIILLCAATAFAQADPADTTSTTTSAFLRSITDFGVSPDNDPAANSRALQNAIDWAAPRGAALSVPPSPRPYPVASGIILRKNVSLIGVNGPTPRGTRNAAGNGPVGSVFEIRDASHAFLTVESATQVRGIQFYYPQQELADPAKIITYPPTIQVSQQAAVYGVTLSCLTFYGEFTSMDFRANQKLSCELILIELCYGYPLSGQFIQLDYCYDIPRLLHCHVNPAIMREMNRHYTRAIIDSVIARKTYAYSIEHTDNAQAMDLFTFGTYGGIHLGVETYGQLTNFNFDCVTVGLWKQGSQAKNRNWQIAQGSIIANAGPKLEDIHPIIVEGHGHTALSNVEAFSGDNPAVSNLRQSQDYLLVRGSDKLTITLTGCRMRDYKADQPFTVENPKAVIQAVACIDKNENLYNKVIPASAAVLP